MTLKKIYNLGLNEIPVFSKDLARWLKGGEILALEGDLGSGKTTFAKNLGKILKVKQRIASPTFILLQGFDAKLPNGKKIFIYHLDLYRAKNFKEVKSLGLTELWGRPNTITLIEWADKIKKYLPKKSVTIKFKNNA